MPSRPQPHAAADDLPRLVRRTYSSTIQQRRDDTAAFESAVETLLTHLPQLGVPAARREVARMLATEPGVEEPADAVELRVPSRR
jgi:hypothetical protein